MARHGCDSGIDHRRLIWSPWIRCQWSDSLLDLPAAAGILALAEDVGSLGPQSEVDGAPFKPQVGLSGEATTEQDSHSLRPTAGDQQPSPASQRRQNLAPHISAGNETEPNASPLQGTTPCEGLRQDACDQRPAPDDQRPTPRVLALFEIAETDDLGAAFVRLFAPHSGYRDRLRSGQCFVRFTPVADAAQRQSATRALREWLHNLPSDNATPSVSENNETISAA